MGLVWKETYNKTIKHVGLISISNSVAWSDRFLSPSNSHQAGGKELKLKIPLPRIHTILPGWSEHTALGLSISDESCETYKYNINTCGYKYVKI